MDDPLMWFADWLGRTPPFKQASAINHWIARRLVDPWLKPLIRPLEQRQARRKIEQLIELRKLCAWDPATTASVDKAIASWTRELAKLDEAATR